MERKVHESSVQAMDVFLEEFKKLIDADGFMAAIWVINDGKLQLACCTTYNFPLEDRPIAEHQLRKVNLSEATLAMAPPPLPLADHLKGPNGGNAKRFVVPPQGSADDADADMYDLDGPLKEDDDEISD